MIIDTYMHTKIMKTLIKKKYIYTFTSQLMAPRGWRVRGLAWRLSQPGFDPSYGKLMSSHTDEF